MTFKELLQTEHPDKLDPASGGGCVMCPEFYGYESDFPCDKADIDCEDCWNREASDVSIRRIDDLGRIAIPKSLRNQLGIQPGDQFVVTHQNLAITFHKIRKETSDVQS